MTSHIRFERRGSVGMVVLDRPAALNALTHDMVCAMSRQLAAWRLDPGVSAVLVKAVPGKAFCAGGDIRAVTETAAREGIEAATRFFAHEYRLNWRIKNFPKPYIALIDGITMGGGVGISVHGQFRVATAATLFAMPETAIGFFPDVGGTWFLPRIPGAMGMFLGLTGARLGGTECHDVGIATHFLPGGRLAEAEDRLAAGEQPEQVLDGLAEPHEPGSLQQRRASIDACFSAASLGEVMDRLQSEPDGWGAEQLSVLASKSPLAMAVTFAQLCRGAELRQFEDAMQLEYRMVHRALKGREFAEGVRALLVDKDRRPRWTHASLAEIRPDEVEAYFAPLPNDDLGFDWEGV